jgi:DNA mismatch repair protein MutL
MLLPRVQVLPENLANLIAAGEVVERPASVVKELLENALDAGARRIEVEIRDAGFALVRVTDDGHGMRPEDARLAFQRHATSKLSDAQGLATIRTLGFRGEALPAIASVSRVELTTRPADSDAGFRLLLEAGVVQSEGEAGSAPGTQVVVRDLFFNTPARRKFMKTPATEQAHAMTAVEDAASAYPEVRFRLLADGRELLNCPVATEPLERLACVYGKSLPSALLPVEREGGGVWVRGLVAAPEHSRPTRQGLHFFLNRRPVDHRGLTHAILEAFRPLLPAGRFPIGFLFLTLPPELVDVNVHPAKREVRLRDEHGVHDLVLAAVRAALTALPAPSLVQPQPAEPGKGAIPSSRTGDYSPGTGWSGERVRQAVAEYLWRPAPPSFPSASALVPEPGEPASSSAEPELRILGQVGRTYLAAQDRDGFFLVDQHAAHERLLYEEFKQQTGQLPRQALLLPLTLELSPSRAVLLEAWRPVFADLGLEISPFGQNTFALQTQPELWQQGNLLAWVQDVLEWAAELGRVPAQQEMRERAMQSMACHAAVKAGDRLQPEAMLSLVRRLSELQPPLTCPHGRPLVHRLSWAELDRLFKRT